jgi:beta-N-acetylhexosaminidase
VPTGPLTAEDRHARRARRDAVRRRRRNALAAVAALALVAGVAAGAAREGGGERSSPAAAAAGVPTPLAPGEDAPAEGSASSPTARETGSPAADDASADAVPSRAALERLAGSAVVLRFRGTSAPAYVVRALRRRRAAGVILFRDNVVSRAQLRTMTRAFHRAAGGRALVMIDQEGGEIRNVPWGPPRTAPPAIGSAGAATATARATARGLRDVGVTVNLAPVADVSSVSGSVMRTRAFPGSASSVARLVDASVRGYHDTGVLPTAKHFPGLGRSTVNTDFGVATVPGRGELTPFAAAIRAGVPLIMTSHALYPELDARRIASQSRTIVTGLLRERLGFRGVVITDSLEAKAVVSRTPTPVAAARALAAGTDLLLTTGRGSYLPVLREVARRARRSNAYRARLEEAVTRVDALRQTLNRPPKGD